MPPLPTIRRACALLTAALAAVVPAPAAADPAVVSHDGHDVTVRPLPCAPDPGYFALTLTYHEAARRSHVAEHEHSTQTATFHAVPVEVTQFDDVPGDDHDHPVPVAWGPRPGSDYAGRATATQTSNGATFTFTVRIKATGSFGERFSVNYVEHQTFARDVVRAAFDHGRCGGA